MFNVMFNCLQFRETEEQRGKEGSDQLFLDGTKKLTKVLRKGPVLTAETDYVRGVLYVMVWVSRETWALVTTLFLNPCRIFRIEQLQIETLQQVGSSASGRGIAYGKMDQHDQTFSFSKLQFVHHSAAQRWRLFVARTTFSSCTLRLSVNGPARIDSRFSTAMRATSSTTLN